MAPERYQPNAELARLGKALVGQLFVLLKTSAHYSEGHAALDAPVARVLEVVREIQRRNEEPSLRLKGNHLYLGDYRIRADAAGFEATRYVTEELKRRLIGRISFSPEVNADEFLRFVYALREGDEGLPHDPYARVLERMQQRTIDQIEVEALAEAPAVEIDRRRLEDDRIRARLFYLKAVNAMEEVMASARSGQPLRFRECKRVVQHLIDLLATREATLLGLTTTRSGEGYTEHHAANVCILSLSMGKRLGMSKFHLCELGMAALFHDLGKAELPREILDKGGERSPEEEELLEGHPLYGVRSLMRLKGLDTIAARIITAIFEHHLLADHSGYPRFNYRRLSLFGRVVSIADSYDALTSPGVRGKKAYPPDKALRFMLTREGKEFDPALLKIFIGCVSLYGIGSLVLLDSHELAVVVEGNPHASPEQPRVKIVADPQGREGAGEVVDLSRSLPPRGVVATLDARAFDLDVSRYLI